MKKRTNQSTDKNARTRQPVRREDLARVGGGGYVPFDQETMVIE